MQMLVLQQARLKGTLGLALIACVGSCLLLGVLVEGTQDVAALDTIELDLLQLGEDTRPTCHNACQLDQLVQMHLPACQSAHRQVYFLAVSQACYYVSSMMAEAALWSQANGRQQKISGISVCACIRRIMGRQGDVPQIGM